MKSPRRVQVQLSGKDERKISELLSKGIQPVRVMRRALILQQLHRGLGAGQVAGNANVAAKTVRAIAYRYQDEGLEEALYEKPRPGAKPVLDNSQKQRIIAMVCGPAPPGQSRWTVRLIAQETKRRKLAPTVGRETIRVLLESHELQPWREKNVVRGRPR